MTGICGSDLSTLAGKSSFYFSPLVSLPFVPGHEVVGDVMDDKGWHLNRNTDPRGLHLMLSPAHAAVADALIADLVDAVASHGESRGVEARYS